MRLENLDRLSPPKVPETSALPCDLFTTSAFRPRDRFDAWRESIGVVFDVSPSNDDARKDFQASVRAYRIDDLFVSAVDFEGQCFRRGAHKIAVDGLDHYLVQLYDRGGFAGSACDKDLIVNPGDVQILDLGRPHSSRTRSSSTVAILVPRDTLHGVLPAALELHGAVLRDRDGRGGLLADYFRSLISRLDSMSLEEAQALRRATVEMIAACFHPIADNLARADSQLGSARRDRIRRYIAANLACADLGPEMLCRQFRLSRAHLYRIFQPLGGVADYILGLRLARAHDELCDPMRAHRRVFEIALDLGFSGEAYFSRAFRRAYGRSPSDVRAQAQEQATVTIMGDRGPGHPREGYEDWIRSLGEIRQYPRQSGHG